MIPALRNRPFEPDLVANTARHHPGSLRTVGGVMVRSYVTLPVSLYVAAAGASSGPVSGILVNRAAGFGAKGEL